MADAYLTRQSDDERGMRMALALVQWAYHHRSRTMILYSNSDFGFPRRVAIESPETHEEGDSHEFQDDADGPNPKSACLRNAALSRNRHEPGNLAVMNLIGHQVHQM